GKPCELDVGGGDIEVDRRLFESIRDPLSHALRNAVDHGIEPPQARRAAGKPGIARISLEAAQVGGELALSVHDDGRGFDFEAIRARAEALGVPGAHRAEGAALAALAFEPGLSTAREVTAISGRGIGLDVVRSKIEEIGGSVALESPPGAGTRLAIRVPLSLAVVPILVMRCGRMRIALRHHHVDYLAEWRGTAPQAPAFLGRRAFDTESGPIPLVDLAATFGETPAPDPRFARIVCVLRAGGLRVGAILDDILDMTEAVVTTCPADVAPSILFGGAVLSADGEVTLALDPARLAEAIGLAPAPERPSVGATAGPPPPMTAWMVCRAGDAPPLAVPATALAEVAAFSEATPFEGGGAVRFRGRLLPLVAEPRASAPRHLLVVTDGERRVGFAADGVEAFFSKTRDVVATGATGGVGVAEIGGVVAPVVDVVAWHDLDRARSAPGRSAIAVLVEDEAFYRDLLASALAAAGFAVETFADAAAAAARLARAPRPSAVAVDHALAPALARELDGLAAEGCPIALLGGEDAPHAPARHARVGKFDRKALAVLLGRPGEGRARAA
ncbi:MAG: chemotaxis protein CheW, partial [Hyphomicrobiales bacterium]|nr:chemotaxis protein CheW [Hyphomicrobiales bacterium]